MLRRETRRRSGATGATGGAEAVAADAVNVLPRCDEGLRERLAVDGGVQLVDPAQPALMPFAALQRLA